ERGGAGGQFGIHGRSDSAEALRVREQSDDRAGNLRSMRLLTPLRESHVHVAQVRRRTHGRAYLYAVLVVGLAAATPAAQRVPSLSITPFKVGEVLSYDISW